MAKKLKVELFARDTDQSGPELLVDFVKKHDVTQEDIQAIVYHENFGFYLFYWKE